MNLASCYRLADGVAVRSERFGGLVYRYDNRRLYFLHSRNVADFVSGLDGLRPLQKAMEDFLDRPRAADGRRRDFGQDGRAARKNGDPRARARPCLEHSHTGTISWRRRGCSGVIGVRVPTSGGNDRPFAS